MTTVESSETEGVKGVSEIDNGKDNAVVETDKGTAEGPNAAGVMDKRGDNQTNKKVEKPGFARIKAE